MGILWDQCPGGQLQVTCGRPGLLEWPRREADARLIFSFLPTQSEERKRIDELIESGKEEGMKVRGRRAHSWKLRL